MKCGRGVQKTGTFYIRFTVHPYFRRGPCVIADYSFESVGIGSRKSGAKPARVTDKRHWRAEQQQSAGGWIELELTTPGREGRWEVSVSAFSGSSG